MALHLNNKRKLALVLLALSSCVVTFAAALAASDESAGESRKRLKRSAQTMHNLCVENTHPQTPLVLRPLLDIVFNDPGRSYCRTLTHFYDWEFFALAEHLKDYIQLPRGTTDEMIAEVGIENIPVKSCKPDDHQRLFYALQWLTSGKSFRTAEFDTGWSKTSCNADLRHVLKAVIRGLDNFVEWPSVEERYEMANQSNGNCLVCSIQLCKRTAA
jgi:hypothetical protein